MDDRGSISSRAKDGKFSVCHHVQTGSGSNPASHPVGTGDLSLRVKRLGREADHSPSFSAEVKIVWSCTTAPYYIFMAWCLAKHRDNFTFYHFVAEYYTALGERGAEENSYIRT
jgi:hypothetical protein